MSILQVFNFNLAKLLFPISFSTLYKNHNFYPLAHCVATVSIFYDFITLYSIPYSKRKIKYFCRLFYKIFQTRKTQ